MKQTTDRKSRRRRGLGAVATAVLATAGAAAGVAGVGVTAASAATTSSSYTVDAFRETIKPWDSISIPELSCPTGYFENTVYSSGRILPKGVEIVDGSAIGTTITDVKSVGVTDYWNKTYHPVTGTDTVQGFSTATNWDPFASHDLVIKLHCTTDLGKAYMDPTYG
jgi:hypothetical protein